MASAAETLDRLVAYRIVAIRGAGSIAGLRARVASQDFAEILKLNRVDATNVARLDSVVVPEPARGFRMRSPFPALAPDLAAEPKLLLVALELQAFAAYDSGRLVRWGPVSTGGATAPTQAGVYHVNWKLPEHRSTIDTTWLMRWCVNIDNDVGTALHQYALPGRPASHCCIRLLEDDASWVYGWVETWRLSPDGRRVLAEGTPVWVFGTYLFEATPPWRRLVADPEADRVDPEAWTEMLANGRR
jgi:hypothetical protein